MLVIKKKIKLIIFDLSGVCFDIEEPPYLEQFVIDHQLESVKNKFLDKYQQLLLEAEVGRLSGIEVWETVLREFHIDADPQKIIHDMMKLKIPHLDVLEIAKKLKENYTVVYLTNYNEDYWAEILRRFDIGEWFSWGVVSYEIGYRKPAKEGFEYILKKAGVKPEEAIFIDDYEKNFGEAIKIGISTYKFVDSTLLGEELRSLGVSIE